MGSNNRISADPVKCDENIIVITNDVDGGKDVKEENVNNVNSPKPKKNKKKKKAKKKNNRNNHREKVQKKEGVDHDDMKVDVVSISSMESTPKSKIKSKGMKKNDKG